MSGAAAPRQWVAAGLITLAAALPYLTALPCGFVRDDIPQILSNPDAQTLWPPWHAFTVDIWGGTGETIAAGEEIVSGLYRPLPLLSHQIQWVIHGPAPFPYHLVNVLLHLAVCLVLWGALRRAGCRDATALITALLFAAAPIHTDAVTSVVGRAELLMSLGCAAAIFTWLGAANGLPPWGRVLGACGWVSLAVFSKENGVAAPVLVILAHWVVHGKADLRRALPRFAALLVPVLLMFLARWGVHGGPLVRNATDVLDNPLVTASFAERFLAAPVILFQGLRLTFLPLVLSADYSLNALPLVPAPILPLLIMMGLAFAWLIAVVAIRPWRRALIAGALGLGAASALVVNWPLTSTVIFAERLFYLPSLFFLLPAGAALAAVGDRQRAANFGIVIAVVGLFVARTAVRNLDWRSDYHLARATVAAVPGSARAQVLWANQIINTLIPAAEAHGAQKQVEDLRADADAALAEALRIYPDYHLCRVLQAQLAAQRGEWDEALLLLDMARDHVPFPPEIEALEAEARSHFAVP